MITSCNINQLGFAVLLRKGREALLLWLPSTPQLWHELVNKEPSFKWGGEQELRGLEEETVFEISFIIQSVD